MTESEATKALNKLLKGLGVTAGETIYVAVDMAHIPLPRWPIALNQKAIQERRNRWCTFLLKQIMELLGPQGTLLVGTFSYSCGNPEIPFVHEDTPSEIGPFTDWIRRHPQSIRSLHPIFSVAGIGHKANEILNNTGGAAFGTCSPFGRLSKYNTRFVNLGTPLWKSLTYVHHLEQNYGCTHRYHKFFSNTVFQNGEKVNREFSGYMRWRGVNAGVDIKPLEDTLRREGVLIEIKESEIFGQSALVRDIDLIGYSLLSKNSLIFFNPKIKVNIDDSIVSKAPANNLNTTFKLSFS